MQKRSFDLIIIGGGAAGMMSAISARRHHPDKSIAILDRTFALGRKILVCGAGRCNITNIHLNESIHDHYYGANDNFIKSIFDQFGFEEIVSFFEDLGVGLYVERKTDIGKMFPITNQAHTITNMLLDEIERAEIEVFLNTEVQGINANIRNDRKVKNSGKQRFTILTREIDRQENTLQELEFSCRHLIFSAGGKTYPALGANGSGYALARDLGHSLVQPVPAALPLEAKNPLSQKLQGVRMEMETTSVIAGEKIKTRTDDVMLTKYGLSGPAILNISRELSLHFNREKKDSASVILNFLPGHDTNSAGDMLAGRWAKRPTQTLEKSLYGLFPNKFVPAFLEIVGIDGSQEVKDISPQVAQALAEGLTTYEIQVTGTRGWNEAEFTAGGVTADEIKESSMESKLLPGLYFAGEIVDVDGDVGGFNLSWSWASGWVSGKLS